MAAAMSSHGGQVNDGAVRCRVRMYGLAYMKSAIQIDAHQLAPIIRCHVGDQLFGIDAGAMYKMINLAVALCDIRGGLFAGLLVGNVSAVRADCAGGAYFR